MKVAAIDIGTNSTRLLIAQSKGENFETLFRLAEITRLGKEVAKAKVIQEEVAKRTLEALTKYRNILTEEGVKKVKVAGTEVLREAKNAPSFLNQVKKKTGFEVEILSPQKEADLAFLGATRLLATGDWQLVLVIDIGGGSTELILGKPQKKGGSAPESASRPLTPERRSDGERAGGWQGLKIFSLRVGSVRLTEMFIKSDPPTLKEIEHVKEYIDKVLPGPAEQIKKTSSEFRVPSSELLAIGVAGTITTLAAIKQKLKVYDWRKVHNSKLSIFDIQKILDNFLKLPLAKRREIVGLEPARADVIIAGTLILIEIMKALNLKELTVSEHDLLDGLLLSLIDSKKPL